MLTAHDLSSLRVVVVECGNFNQKFRKMGGPWVIEPALVRVAPTSDEFTFSPDGDSEDGSSSTPLRPFVYLSGPADLPSTPFLVGADAVRVDTVEVPIIGSAESRVRTINYLVQHLHGIVASLPPGVTSARIAFAGGLPVLDSRKSSVSSALRRRLTGRDPQEEADAKLRGEHLPAVPHVIQWGQVTYHITIELVSLTPQVHAGVATMIFDEQGNILTNGAMKKLRFALDIGGGTTDIAGLVGMKPLDGTEDGFNIGITNAAEKARAEIVRKWPQMAGMGIGAILNCYRANTNTIYVGGEPQDISAFLKSGAERTAEEIVAYVTRPWQRRLAEGEVVMFGGGSQRLSGPLSRLLGQTTRVSLLSDPVTRVADGLERLAKFNMRRMVEQAA